jgi:hypothetical protein
MSARLRPAAALAAVLALVGGAAWANPPTNQSATSAAVSALATPVNAEGAARTWAASGTLPGPTGWHDFFVRPHVGSHFVHVLRGGDMTGEGVPDLVQLRDEPGGWFSVAARAGDTGRLLWSDTSPATSIAVPTDVGGVNGGGVLLVRRLWDSPGAGYATVTQILTLLGHDGRVRWSDTRTGQFIQTPAGVDYYDLPGVVDLDAYLPGGAPAVVVVQGTGEFTGGVVVADWRSSLQVSLLAVRDGASTAAGSVNSPGGPATLGVFGRLFPSRPPCTGLAGSTATGQASVEVRCGDTKVWSSAIATQAPLLVPAGDIDCDGVRDVLVLVDTGLGLPYGSVRDVTGSAVPTPSAAPVVLSGVDGRMLPTHLPADVIADGSDCSTRGAAPFLQASFQGTAPLLFRLRGLRKDGSTLYERNIPVTPAGTAWQSAMAVPAGDLDLDGTQDFDVQASVKGRDRPYLIRVLTGRGMPAATVTGDLLGDSLTGRGLDQAAATIRGDGTVFSIHQAATGQLVASGTVARQLPTEAESYVTGPRHHTLLVTRTGNRLAAIDLATNELAWTD